MSNVRAREAARVAAVRQQEQRAAVIVREILFTFKGDAEKSARIIADFAAQEVQAATRTQAAHGRIDWVPCPVCGETDMERVTDDDENVLINCVNHACKSNGGTYSLDYQAARCNLLEEANKNANGHIGELSNQLTAATARCEKLEAVVAELHLAFHDCHETACGDDCGWKTALSKPEGGG